MKFPAVIILSALCLSCSEKGHDSVWWENKKTIIELSNRLELEQFRSEMTQDTAESEDIVTDINAIEAEISFLVSHKDSLENEILDLSDGWDTFRRKILTEKRAFVIGTTFQEFESEGGKIYTNVVVTTIDDSGVAIRHTDGTARLRVSDLDPSGHAFFGLEEEFAQDAINAELKQRVAYEKWIEKGMVAQEKKQLAAAQSQKREEEKRAAQRLLTTRNSAVTSVHTSPQTSTYSKLGDTRHFSGRTSYYSGYRRSTFYRYYTPTRVYSSILSSRPTTYGNGVTVQPPSCGTSILETR